MTENPILTITSENTVITQGDKILGELIAGDDGYYLFFPDEMCKGGGFTADNFRQIANLIDEKNKKWDNTVKQSMRADAFFYWPANISWEK